MSQSEVVSSGIPDQTRSTTSNRARLSRAIKNDPIATFSIMASVEGVLFASTGDLFLGGVLGAIGLVVSGTEKIMQHGIEEVIKDSKV